MSNFKPIGGGYCCDCGVSDIDECRSGKDCRAIRRPLMVRIWSGEWKAYWQPIGHGYTHKVEEAGVFSAEDALRWTEHLGPEKEICIEWRAPPLDYTTDDLPPSREAFKEWYETQYLSTRRVLKPSPPQPKLDERDYFAGHDAGSDDLEALVETEIDEELDCYGINGRSGPIKPAAIQG